MLVLNKSSQRGKKKKCVTMEGKLPLHLCHVQKSSTIINRSHMLLHFIALIALCYYRAAYFFQETRISDTPILPWLLVFASELLLSFLWILNQAFRWRPILRIAFPERLPEDETLVPAIDVFICTADPDKEPTVEVMSTVLSAMALDYPPEKLSVYLSDDSGSSSTLHAMKEALGFARWWIPFCRTYGVKTRCPSAYFSASDDDFGDLQGTEFVSERQKIKEQYEMFKERVKGAIENARIINRSINTGQDHPPVIEIIHDKLIDAAAVDSVKMPLLVYVSREKRSSQPHHFKAGALNVLLRVSGVISNFPYILVLDCDMYCNDPTSAKQAMCFHLDPKISTSLAFVQFPQRFHNIGKNDIYDSQLRSLFTTQWEGMDGHVGPVLSGTGFYMKREALYGSPILKDADLMEHKQDFGPSNDFIKSLNQNYKHKSNVINIERYASNELLQETQLIASCSYEHCTKWGEEVGFLYHYVVEDFLTGFNLHCKGWTSVFYSPTRPQFLGSATTKLDDVLVQQTRWYSGLLGVGISRFCPLLYGPLRMSVLESMCYAEIAFFPLYCLPICCLAIIPQLCLLHGIPLYPEVSSLFFTIYSFIFTSSLLKHLYEVVVAGGSIQTWRNEQRMWIIKSVTSYLYGSLDAFMNKFGMKEANFLPTNKLGNDEQVKLYKIGKFDFQTSTMFLVPLVSLVTLNMVSFVAGVARLIFLGDCEKLFLQVCLSLFGLIMSYPIIEGMLLRKDEGRISPKAILSSTVFFMLFLSLGYILLAAK